MIIKKIKIKNFKGEKNERQKRDCGVDFSFGYVYRNHGVVDTKLYKQKNGQW